MSNTKDTTFNDHRRVIGVCKCPACYRWLGVRFAKWALIRDTLDRRFPKWVVVHGTRVGYCTWCERIDLMTGSKMGDLVCRGRQVVHDDQFDDCASAQHIFTFDTTDDIPYVLDDVRDTLAHVTADYDGLGAVIVIRTDHPSPDLRDDQWNAFFDDLLEEVRRRIHDPAGEGLPCALDS